jgi:putative FmdB family regulatory protein
MPTYEYLCGNCDHRFEAMQSIKSKPLRKCPSCGKQKLKRLIGAGSGIIFKGSGFYQTDYRSDSYTKGSNANTPAPATTPAKDAPKTETKPAPQDGGKKEKDSSAGTGTKKTNKKDS